MLSCGDDDSNSGSGLKPSTITIAANPSVSFNMAYDNKNRLSTITQSGFTATFTYGSDNKLDLISNGTNSYQFNYADNGNLVSVIDEDDDQLPISQTGENAYMYDGTLLTFDEQGDWKSAGTTSFTYAAQKGPFANVKHLNQLALQLVLPSPFFYTGKKRLESLNPNGVPFTITATEGERGLPATYSFNGSTISFQYQ